MAINHRIKDIEKAEVQGSILAASSGGELVYVAPGTDSSIPMFDGTDVFYQSAPAINGLSYADCQIKLGGDFDENTDIEMSGYKFRLIDTPHNSSFYISNVNEFMLHFNSTYNTSDAGAHGYSFELKKKGMVSRYTDSSAVVTAVESLEGKFYIGPVDGIWNTLDFSLQVNGNAYVYDGNLLVGSKTDNGEAFQVTGVITLSDSMRVNTGSTEGRITVDTDDNYHSSIYAMNSQEMSESIDITSGTFIMEYGGGATTLTTKSTQASVFGNFVMSHTGNVVLDTDGEYATFFAKHELNINGFYSVSGATISGFAVKTVITGNTTYNDVAGLMIFTPERISGAGVVDAYYGVYIEDLNPAGIANSSFAIYAPGPTDQVFINGPVSIGTPTTNAKLTVNGDISTSDPGNGLGIWKLGQVQAVTPGSITADTNNYLEVAVGGSLVKIMIAV